MDFINMEEKKLIVITKKFLNFLQSPFNISKNKNILLFSNCVVNLFYKISSDKKLCERLAKEWVIKHPDTLCLYSIISNFSFFHKFNLHHTYLILLEGYLIKENNFFKNN